MILFLPQVSNEPGNRYNIQLINALVLYVGTQAIAHIHNKGSTPSMSTITHSAHMDIFQNLAVDLDTEGEPFKKCSRDPNFKLDEAKLCMYIWILMLVFVRLIFINFFPFSLSFIQAATCSWTR